MKYWTGHNTAEGGYGNVVDYYKIGHENVTTYLCLFIDIKYTSKSTILRTYLEVEEEEEKKNTYCFKP